MRNREGGTSPEVEIEVSKEKLEQFEQLKQSGPFWAIQKGREQLGLPESLIQAFIDETIQTRTEQGDFNFLRRFMMAVGRGSPDELKELDTKAFERALTDDPHQARELAKELYGEASQQFAAAQAAIEKHLARAEAAADDEAEPESGEKRLALDSNATMADLFRALDQFEAGQAGESVFFRELYDNFDLDLTHEFLELQTDYDQAGQVTVAAFFKKYGYSKSDIKTFLPVKFQRRRKP